MKKKPEKSYEVLERNGKWYVTSKNNDGQTFLVGVFSCSEEAEKAGKEFKPSNRIYLEAP